MLLTPRYDGTPVITIDGDPLDQREPLIRQRRRLASTLASLSDEQWAHPSRCELWSVQDVVSHLVDVNRFWTMSIRSGVAGAPTRFLATFDPVTSPPQLVNAAGDPTPAEVLERFVATNEALADTVDGLDADGWNALAEAPPGHMSVRALAHHALWDGWIHERDIGLPLGLDAVEEPDEVRACLRYCAALSAAFAANADRTRRGALIVEATDPAMTVLVTVEDSVRVSDVAPDPIDGAAHVSGRAMDLIEMISLRAPFTVPIRPEHAWLFDGLPTVFDSKLDRSATSR